MQDCAPMFIEEDSILLFVYKTSKIGPLYSEIGTTISPNRALVTFTQIGRY